MHAASVTPWPNNAAMNPPQFLDFDTVASVGSGACLLQQAHGGQLQAQASALGGLRITLVLPLIEAPV